MKEYAFGKQSIGTSLFVEMATELDNLEAKYRFFAENIMDPIASGQVYKIEISDVVQFNNSEFRNFYINSLNEQNINELEAIAFKIKLSLKEDFKANLERVLENISDGQKQLRRSDDCFNDGGRSACKIFGYPSSELGSGGKHLQIAYFQKDNQKVNMYVLENLKSFLRENDNPYSWTYVGNDYGCIKDCLANLEIIFFNGNNKFITSYYVDLSTHHNTAVRVVNNKSVSGGIGTPMSTDKSSYLIGISRPYSRNLQLSRLSQDVMKRIEVWDGHLGGINFNNGRSIVLFDELTFNVMLKMPVNILKEVGTNGTVEVRYLD